MLVWACSLDLDSQRRAYYPWSLALPPSLLFASIPVSFISLPPSALTRQDQTRQTERCGSPWQRAPPCPNSWRRRDNVERVEVWQRQRGWGESFSQLDLTFGLTLSLCECVSSQLLLDTFVILKKTGAEMAEIRKKTCNISKKRLKSWCID